MYVKNDSKYESKNIVEEDFETTIPIYKFFICSNKSKHDTFEWCKPTLAPCIVFFPSFS